MLLTLALALLAAAPPSPSPKPPAKPPVLEGVVVDPGGKPVADAAIRARATGMWDAVVTSVRTDRRGAFRIALTRGGPHDLVVEKDGLAPAIRPAVKPGEPIRVALSEGAVLEGVVRDAATRQPVAACARSRPPTARSR